MSIAINSNFQRNQLIASSTGQTLFTYSFPIYDETYLSVFQYSAGTTPNQFTQKLTLGVDYSVQGVGQEAGGTITLAVGATINDIITIMGTEPIDRTSVFQDLNPFTVALNQQLNELTIMMEQNYTYWNHFTTRYNADELVSDQVRPLKRILPMLPNGHVWVGRGEIGQTPDDIITMPYAQGMGGGTGVTAIITQSTAGLAIGNWVRINSSGLYVPALRDGAEDAEVVGVIIAILSATQFVLQQSGYIESSQAIFSGLTIGVYFLDINIPGNMTINDAVINGQVSRALFIADKADAGWVLPYRGLIVGGAAPPSSNMIDSNIHTIVQANTFTPGQVVRVSTANTAAAPITYALAQADTLSNAQAVGIVTADPAPTTSQFTLQFAGYNLDSLTQDDAMAALVPSTTYYLSSTVAGAVTSIDPGLSNLISKPIYITEQAPINAGLNSGYILPQRPLMNDNGAIAGSVLLQTQIIPNTTSVVSFNNVLSSMYNCYKVVLENILPNATPVRLDMRVGTGSVPTYQTTGYLGWTYWGASTGLSYFGQSSPTSAAQVNNGLYMNNVQPYRSCGEINIFNVNDSSPTYIQTRFSSSNYNVSNPVYPVPTLCQGTLMWNNSTAITSLQFLFSSGTFFSGRISIYGINQ